MKFSLLSIFLCVANYLDIIVNQVNALLCNPILYQIKKGVKHSFRLNKKLVA
jgi:hypothetical protein